MNLPKSFLVSIICLLVGFGVSTGPTLQAAGTAFEAGAGAPDLLIKAVSGPAGAYPGASIAVTYEGRQD
jgi:hypothetical protein